MDQPDAAQQLYGLFQAFVKQQQDSELRSAIDSAFIHPASCSSTCHLSMHLPNMYLLNPHLPNMYLLNPHLLNVHLLNTHAINRRLFGKPLRRRPKHSPLSNYPLNIRPSGLSTQFSQLYNRLTTTRSLDQVHNILKRVLSRGSSKI